MEIRSSTNYIWNIKDVLGQGATGAVYKGRNKVFYRLLLQSFLLSFCSELHDRIDLQLLLSWRFHFQSNHPQKTGDTFAVKISNQLGMMRPVEVRRREFEVLNKLNHENIVKLFASETEVSFDRLPLQFKIFSCINSYYCEALRVWKIRPKI